jgi:hypothetical protein
VQPYLDDELVREWSASAEKCTITLIVDVLDVHDMKTTVTYPKDGKKGNYVIEETDDNGKKTKIAEFESLEVCLRSLLKNYAEQRDIAMEMYGGEFTPLSSTVGKKTDPFEGGDEQYDEDGNLMVEDIGLEGDFVDNTYFAALHEYLTGQIAMDKKKHLLSMNCIEKEQIQVSIYIDPNIFGLSSWQADAWGMDLYRYIGVCITFFTQQGQEEKHPKVEVFQVGDVGKKSVNDGKRKKFILYWTIGDRIMFTFFTKKWWPFATITQRKDQTLMKELLIFSEQVVLNSSKRCMICDDKILAEGLRPTICPKTLCTFRCEQFGLGQDLESDIENSPEVFDLMITMAYSASTSDGSFDPFIPFPSGVEVKIKEKYSDRETTYDFLKNGVNDKPKVQSLIESIPKMSDLLIWVKKGILREECNKISVLIYPFLRWLMASNRCFLKLLAGDKQIKQMNTKYQFALLNATPEKESIFNAARQKYGSFYAWHGSSLCNWHAIMRNGLKNMSGTSGQLNGAAYGSGVYLAAESGTSFGYMRYTKGWSNSIYGTTDLGCIALCEVVNYPALKGQPNPYYVVPDDNMITTRYFFIYPGSGTNVSLVAKDIEMRNVKDLL